jgi:pyridoxal 5'-phosphate synthase pdxS subunit
MSIQIDRNNLRQTLKEYAKTNSLFGTCAGMILLSSTKGLKNLQPLDIMDFTVTRNAYGRQIKSFSDDNNHIYKHDFKCPFVCGARNLGEALRRIGEGAAMIRTKGEAGSGNIVEAVRHMRNIINEIQRLTTLNYDQLMSTSRDLQAPFTLIEQVAKISKLPVPNFSAGGIATPADASLVMQLGAESVFVGSGIFKSEDPVSRARAIVESVTYYQDPNKLAEISENLKSAMKGLEISEIHADQMMQERGW